MAALHLDNTDTAHRMLDPASHPNRAECPSWFRGIHPSRACPNEIHEDIVPRPQTLHEVDRRSFIAATGAAGIDADHQGIHLRAAILEA